MGCSTPAPHAPWAEARGGLANGAVQDRVDAAAGRLCGACNVHGIRVRVLDTDDVCAYGWPAGEIYLTRGLVERLDDAEIAAAIAHELGHLLLDGHAQTVVSLRGCGTGADVESRADLAGVALLTNCHISPDAMSRMLRKVLAAGKLSPRTRAAIERRIEVLNSR